MKIKVFIFVVCSMVFLFGCRDKVPQVQHSADTKIFHQIDPDQPMVEQPILIQLTLPEQVQPQLSKVTGVNMYMGAIPLVWQQQTQTRWQAELLLGACAEPLMQWRVTVPLLNGEQQLSPYVFEFSTKQH
ncbi:MAG: hypothetical protein R3273_02520 [Pseudidiomarina maritima]|nr:hypothetical protein [Pseudidiomarina maritima]